MSLDPNTLIEESLKNKYRSYAALRKIVWQNDNIPNIPAKIASPLKDDRESSINPSKIIASINLL